MASSLLIVLKAPRHGVPATHFAGPDAEKWKATIKELGLPTLRTNQIARHYYSRPETSPMAMTDLSETDRQKVKDSLFPPLLTPVHYITCDDDETRKALWRAGDGTLLESVLVEYPRRATLCTSSQAGCGMAYPFCATGQDDLQRNLSTAGIVDQVRGAAATMAAEDDRLMNIVFMGIDEPLASYNRVLTAIHHITRPSPEGFGISIRNVTVSTIGFVSSIRRFADEDLSVILAVSLHAPDDEPHDGLIPINNRFTVAEVLGAARYYADKTGRRILVEYTLIRDINDQDWRADLLGKKLHNALDSRVHVSLIPLSPTPGSKWDASPKKQQGESVHRIQAQGVPCTVHDIRGNEIATACGQLAAGEV